LKNFAQVVETLSADR